MQIIDTPRNRFLKFQLKFNTFWLTLFLNENKPCCPIKMQTNFYWKIKINDSEWDPYQASVHFLLIFNFLPLQMKCCRENPNHSHFSWFFCLFFTRAYLYSTPFLSNQENNSNLSISKTNRYYTVILWKISLWQKDSFALCGWFLYTHMSYQQCV